MNSCIVNSSQTHADNVPLQDLTEDDTKYDLEKIADA